MTGRGVRRASGPRPERAGWTGMDATGTSTVAELLHAYLSDPDAGWSASEEELEASNRISSRASVNG